MPNVVAELFESCAEDRWAQVEIKNYGLSKGILQACLHICQKPKLSRSISSLRAQRIPLSGAQIHQMVEILRKLIKEACRMETTSYFNGGRIKNDKSYK